MDEIVEGGLDGQQRKKRAQTRCVIFLMYKFFILFLLPSSQRQPTQANAGQHRPTQPYKGPQQPTTANEGQRRSTKTHSSQRRPTTANEGQRRSTKANAGPWKAHGSQRRPTKANAGPRRPTVAIQ